MGKLQVFMSPMGLVIFGILLLGVVVGMALRGPKARRRGGGATAAFDPDFEEEEHGSKASRPGEYPDFASLLEHFIQPLAQAHPGWERLDGARGVPGQPVAWFQWNGIRYSLGGETSLAAMLRARDWMRENPGAEPLVIKPTKRGAGRLALNPEIGWAHDKEVRIETG
ncbi:hypothetical protein [Muricoccus aerilatus]|uniref:hypothetical protein n=1 Tax=Muricoccus aerilatus TaxID=452982 RepID=UPI0005C26572|nr:hypothetical protein [Roseomonas aerilata]